MRMQIRLCLFLFVAVPALVTASQVSSNCILGCKCQEELGYGNKLRILDCDYPLVLSKTTFVDFSKNITNIMFKNVVIKKIDNNTFDGFDSLETMQIEDSSIGAIDSSAFNLPELGTINFVRTTFTEIPVLNSSYLDELIFNNCKITEVPKLDYLPELDFLNLANNKISYVDEMAFSKSTNLEEVTLSNNSISKLPYNLFINNPNFNSLNLDHNPLESFSLNLTSDLELLSLKFCKLTVFDRNSAKNLDVLSSLSLTGNQISVLNIDTFENMQELNYIDLANNKLVELDDTIFENNNKLDKIVLDNNQFEKLPNFQTKTTPFNTNHFSCKNCGLKSIDNAFENMRRLVTLDLSNNKLKSIDDAFTEMKLLKQLDLSHNLISTVSGKAFGENGNLEVLDLSYNPLKPLDPVVFTNMWTLKELYINNCNLTKLWTNHNAVFSSLERLIMGKNNFTELSAEDLQLAPKLKIIDLQDNPLQCTPTLHNLIKYLLNKPVYPVEKSDLFKTHESMMLLLDSTLKQELPWRELALACRLDDLESTYDDEDDDYDINSDEDIDDEEDDEIDDNDEDGNEEDNELFVIGESTGYERSIRIANVSWILSIFSVFMLSALVVLTIAVAVTLLILKRNKSLNMQNANFPRFKIPLWNTAPGQKRHSGSVYKPLSEDLSGPRTPIINRYEFKQTPQVHNSIP